MIFLILRILFGKAFNRRYDSSALLPYWDASSFGVEEERFYFPTANGWFLSGSRYFLKGKKPKGLIVFFHGIGDGRLSYIKEICQLAKEGYIVYAYDNTGCQESQGNRIYSLDRTIVDQKYFFAWLDEDLKAQGLRRYAVGHSWGGYGAIASCQDAYKIEKAVSFAGYMLFADEFIGLSKGKLAIFKPLIKLIQRTFVGKNANLNAMDIFEKSHAKLLYFQGDKDSMVDPKRGYYALKKRFGDDKRVELHLLEGSMHSPFRSHAAEKYVTDLIEKGITSLHSKDNLEMDLNKATEENEEVWERVFSFLSE